MTTTYRTSDGDVLDAIVFSHYGSNAPIGKVMEVNPGLADQPAILPAGLLIMLPEVPIVQTRKTIRLFD